MKTGFLRYVLRRSAMRPARCGALCALLCLMGAVFVPSSAVRAQTFDDPVSVLPDNALSQFTYTGAAGNKTTVPVGGQSFSQAIQVHSPAAPASEYGDGEYSTRLRVFTSRAIAQGDTLLATFWARCAQPAGGNAYTRFVVEGPAPDYTKLGNLSVEMDGTWREFKVVMRAGADWAARSLRVEFWTGYDPQVIQVGGVSVLNYGPGVSAEDLGVVYSYEGREPDAAWREAAQERIERIRKGDLTALVQDQNGNALPDAAVQVRMRRHAFGFGSAVVAAGLLGATANDRIYQDKVKQLFNKVVMENDLKWPGWESNRQRALDGVAWLRNNGIEVRGHNLVWPNWRNMPGDVYDLRNDPEALRGRIDSHIMEEAGALRGQLAEWDVLNEPYTNHDVLDILGKSEMVRWFQLAREADPDAKLYINDYGIYERHGWDIRHRNHYYNTIQFLLDSGAPLDGIGMQSHFGGTSLTAPDRLLQVLDQFAAFGLPIEVTEFDISTSDEQLQGDYTRDFLTTLFSHPSVNAVLMWGFWEGRHWIPGAALYRRDWSIKPNGEAYNDLVFNQWWTNADGATDESGRYTVRGFQGDYEVTVEAAGQTQTVPTALPGEGTTLTVTVTLPDGAVEGAPRQRTGRSVKP